MDLFDLIGNIRKRPAMYLGKVSIGQLRTFLAGYSFARRQMNVLQTPQEKTFTAFQGWIEQRFGVPSQHQWDQIIREASESEEDAMQQFFDLFDEFIQSQSSKHSSQTSPEKEMVPMVGSTD